jgi:dTDP-4-dehydrorhamnose reductase
MSKKILIIGLNSQVAQALFQHIANVKLYSLDLRKNKTFLQDLNKKIDKYKIKHIVNCIAYNDVVNSKKNFSEALKLNSDFPGLLSSVCLKKKIKLIHFSTDYVFDGKKKSGYFPFDKCNPLNHYGLSKYAGELQIKNSGCDYIIIRLCGVYGEFRENFLKTIVKKIMSKKIIKLPNNLICNPVFVNDIVKLLNFLIEDDHTKNKIIHFGGKDILSWFEFGKKISKIMENMNLLSKNYKIFENRNSEDLIIRPINSTILDCTSYNKYKTEMNDAIAKILKKIA